MKTLILLTILPVFFLTSCQSLDTFIQEPRVSLNSVNIASVSLSGVNLVAIVDVENPNSFSIPMPNIEWELLVNNVSFLNGTVENVQSIMGRGKTTFNIPVNVGYERLFRTFSSLLGTREAAYNLDMGLRFPSPLLHHRVFNLNHSGVLPLSPL